MIIRYVNRLSAEVIARNEGCAKIFIVSHKMALENVISNAILLHIIVSLTTFKLCVGRSIITRPYPHELQKLMQLKEYERSIFFLNLFLTSYTYTLHILILVEKLICLTFYNVIYLLFLLNKSLTGCLLTSTYNRKHGPLTANISFTSSNPQFVEIYYQHIAA